MAAQGVEVLVETPALLLVLEVRATPHQYPPLKVVMEALE
jgi:hypothetical protein